MNLFALLLSCFALSSLSAYDITTLSLEEKVGQLLMVHMIGQECGDDARLLVQKAHVGGIIYFRMANGLTNPDQVRRLSAGFQDLARIPLFIAIDQEGGPITHLKQGFTLFPSNWAVGLTDNPEYARLVALASSQELKAVGINMNLAPVVDVNTNPLNPVIGIRSFGTTPEQVALFGKAALAGYHEGGMIATLKHFPGHGDVAVDSHYGLPITHKTVQELEVTELIPFAMLAKDAEVIMSAHLLVPAIDSEKCATFSTSILQGILREKLGFKGVIISDSLLMDGALLQAGSLENAAIDAFNAGCDLLIIAGAFSKETLGSANSMYSVHQALVRAVQDGKISVDRLNASVERILDLKEAHGLIDHKSLANKVAKASVQTIYNSLPPGFSSSSMAIISPEAIMPEVSQTNMAQKADSIVYYKTLQPSDADIDRAVATAQDVDVLVVLSANAWKFPNQVELVKRLQQTGKPVLLICVGMPQDAQVQPPCAACVASFGPTPASLDAAFDKVL